MEMTLSVTLRGRLETGPPCCHRTDCSRAAGVTDSVRDGEGTRRPWKVSQKRCYLRWVFWAELSRWRSGCTLDRGHRSCIGEQPIRRAGPAVTDRSCSASRQAPICKAPRDEQRGHLRFRLKAAGSQEMTASPAQGHV